MRLMAREEDIYKLMDLRDRYLWGAGFCFLAAAVSLYFLTHRPLCWDLVYFAVVFGLSCILLFYHMWKAGRQIMEAGCCYMELDGESLAVCQPQQNGRYESCRIYYDEMEKIVEGSRRGIPEFYVVVAPGGEKESFILLEEEEQARKIFCVRSLGYEPEKFREFYRKLRWEVPGKVRIFGTKYQTVWEKKKSHAGCYIAVVMILGYIVLKLVLIYGGF